MTLQGGYFRYEKVLIFSHLNIKVFEDYSPSSGQSTVFDFLDFKTFDCSIRRYQIYGKRSEVSRFSSQCLLTSSSLRIKTPRLSSITQS